MKPTRFVSSRVPIKAHHAQIYKFLDNFDNHKQILPGLGGWSADKDSARYGQAFGLARSQAESKIVERHVGLRICEESAGSAALKFRRYYKIQQDDQTSVCEISIIFPEGLSFARRLLMGPFVKGVLNRTLFNLKALMEKPKETRAPAAVAAQATGGQASAAPPPPTASSPTAGPTAAVASAGE